MAGNKEATLLIRVKTAGEAAISAIGSGIKNVGAIAAAAFTGIAGFMGKALADYREQEKAVNSLNQAMANQGIYSKALSKEYQAQASELQKLTTYGDEQIIAAQTTLQGYAGEQKVTKELTKSVLDLAAAKGMDLGSAADLVGKAITGNTVALSKMGIEVDGAATAEGRLSNVVDALSGRFGGQAEAAAKGLGAFDQLKNTLSDVMEVIGERAAPMIAFITRKISDFIVEIQSNESALSTLTGAFDGVVMVGIYLKAILETVGKVAGAVIGTIAGALSQLMEGQFKMAYESIKGGFTDIPGIVAASFESAKNLNDEKNAAIAAANAEARAMEEQLEDQSAANHAIKVQEKQDADLLAIQTANLNELIEEQAKYQAKEAMGAESTAKEQANAAARMVQLKKLSADEIALEREKKKLKEQLGLEQVKQQEFYETQKYQTVNSNLGAISSLSSSKSKELAAIGKAAAIAQITMNTASAITRGFSDLGPIGGAIFMPFMIAVGAAQIAKATGAELAEGGIVLPTPGGTQATIGEGGNAEAVIPLTEENKSLGRSVHVTVYGGLLGDEASAREFALAVDEQLTKLRQNNESFSYDAGIV